MNERGKITGIKQELISGLAAGILLGSILGLTQSALHIQKNQFLRYGFFNIALSDSVSILNSQVTLFVALAFSVALILSILTSKRGVPLILITTVYVFVGYYINKRDWFPDFLTFPAMAGNGLIALSWLILFMRLSRKRPPPSPEKRFVKAALCFLLLILLLNAVNAVNQRLLQEKISSNPNVILISIDALRADHVGSSGYPENTTPALDALAREGVRFENHIADASWTLPSHAALLTSRYPHNLGVETRYQKIPISANTLAEILKNRGYKTKGIISFTFVETLFHFNQGFDDYDISNSFYLGEYRDKFYKSSGDLTDKAIEWVEENKNDRFFIFLHYFDVHEPYNPQAPYDKMFNSSNDSQMNLYDGEIRFTDSHIARLVAKVKELGLKENTLIIITADHGDAFMEHGYVGHERTLYEEVVRVPLMVSLPGVFPAGALVMGQTQSVDIGASILDVLGFPTPQYFDGRTLVPVILGETGAEGREYAFTRVISHWYDKEMVRTPKYKLIHTFEPLNPLVDNTTRVHSWELYDLQEDPLEKNNLYDELPVEAEKLKDVLYEHYRNYGEDGRGGGSVLFDEKTRKRLESLGYL